MIDQDSEPGVRGAKADSCTNASKPQKKLRRWLGALRRVRVVYCAGSIMPKKGTQYISPADIAKLAVIGGLVYAVYALGGIPLLLGTGWATTMKAQGRAPDCEWTQVLRFYHDLDHFSALL